MPPRIIRANSVGAVWSRSNKEMWRGGQEGVKLERKWLASAGRSDRASGAKTGATRSRRTPESRWQSLSPCTLAQPNHEPDHLAGHAHPLPTEDGIGAICWRCGARARPWKRRRCIQGTVVPGNRSYLSSHVICHGLRGDILPGSPTLDMFFTQLATSFVCTLWGRTTIGCGRRSHAPIPP